MTEAVPQFMVETEFARRFNFPYSTVHSRVVSGEIQLHFINRCLVINVEEARAVMSKVRRRPRRFYTVPNDLFSGAE